MNPVVTARVPEGVRARGVDVLREIGSSTSELVNAAFDYVIKERRLPTPEAPAKGAPDRRSISGRQMEQLASFMDNVRVDIPASWADAPFEDLLDQAMEERYARLR